VRFFVPLEAFARLCSSSPPLHGANRYLASTLAGFAIFAACAQKQSPSNAERQRNSVNTATTAITAVLAADPSTAPSDSSAVPAPPTTRLSLEAVATAPAHLSDEKQFFQGRDATTLANGADAGIQNALSGRRVWHAGDSMVGGESGLNRALRNYFSEAGATYSSDTVVSASIASFHKTRRFARGVQSFKADIVIVTLGANDVFVPNPDALAPHVRAIVKQIGGRECYWIAPPTWKQDTGVVDVIAANIAPCKFFDSRGLELSRTSDRIHPNEKGGVAWATQFVQFFEREHTARARLVSSASESQQ
jgi:hypothetical protein